MIIFVLKLLKLRIVQLNLLFQVVLENIILCLLLQWKWKVGGIFVFIIKRKEILLNFKVLQSIQVRIDFALDVIVLYHSALDGSFQTITLIILLVQCKFDVIFSILIISWVLSEQCFKWCSLVWWTVNVKIFGIMMEMSSFWLFYIRVIMMCTTFIDPIFEFIT